MDGLLFPTGNTHVYCRPTIYVFLCGGQTAETSPIRRVAVRETGLVVSLGIMRDSIEAPLESPRTLTTLSYRGV